MPLQKRKAGVPLGPKGSNGRRLKTQAEKEATKRKKEARKADLARQARDPRVVREARDRLFARQVSFFLFSSSCFSSCFLLLLTFRLARNTRRSPTQHRTPQLSGLPAGSDSRYARETLCLPFVILSPET